MEKINTTRVDILRHGDTEYLENNPDTKDKNLAINPFRFDRNRY